MITCGIDVGSITTKAAIARDGVIIADKVIPTGYNARLAGEEVLNKILVESQVERATVDTIVSTGYGRNNKAIPGGYRKYFE